MIALPQLSSNICGKNPVLGSDSCSLSFYSVALKKWDIITINISVQFIVKCILLDLLGVQERILRVLHGGSKEEY